MSEETRCRICGRRLTVPGSVKREIGPVCWGRLKRGEVTMVTSKMEDFYNQALKKEAEEKKHDLY